MLGGTHNFSSIVQEIFADIISRYNYHFTETGFDTVKLENGTTELIFGISEEDMTMYIKSQAGIFVVGDIAYVADKEYYLDWLRRLDATGKSLGREPYYRNYLQFFRELSLKFLGDAWTTGIIPFEKQYNEMKERQRAEDKKFSRAWDAMQKLDYSDPVRQKYIADDASWMNDMISRLDNGE